MALNRIKVLKQADKLVRQGRIDAAILEYQRLLEESPKDPTLLNKIGDLYCRAGQAHKAVSSFLKIAERLFESRTMRSK